MRVFLDSVGCRLNQSEIERLALQFRAAGHEIVNSAGEADLVIVNTCAVTHEAASDSRQKIRQVGRAGKAAIAATGCWVTLEPQAAATLPGVKWVVANAEKEKLVAEVLRTPVESMDLEPMVREPLPGVHLRTRAFIKVQDGCDNFCTFCVTRITRGKGRSILLDEILLDVQRALKGGAKEIVLSGVHLGSWGKDLASPMPLRYMITAILREKDLARLRLSSLEPWDLDDEFFELWQDRRMCRHLHLPLQSGCAATLKRMVRKVSPESYARLVSRARQAIEGLAITTDLIAGFPGEDEREFQETLEFVRTMQFAGGHVFSFSSRPGTAAARLPAQVPAQLRKQRGAVLRQELAESSIRFRQQFIGQTTKVLWEGGGGVDAHGWTMVGLTDHYIRVAAGCQDRRWNQIDLVRLDDLEGDGMRATLLEPLPPASDHDSAHGFT
jgi:threonylcarbamoyladenosine tRNA methylthiotransferase MtaB